MSEGVPDIAEASCFFVGFEQRDLVDPMPKGNAHGGVAQFVNRRAQPSGPHDAAPAESFCQSSLGHSFDLVNNPREHQQWDRQHQQQLQCVSNRDFHGLSGSETANEILKTTYR